MRDSEIPTLSLKAKVRYAEFRLDVDEQIVLDGVTGLFGPSGGGKSTLLRVIAGLERDVEGRVKFINDTWLDSESRKFVPAHSRPLGYVFQDGRLFSHLTVEGNLRFAADRSVVRKDAIQYDEILATFDLRPLLHRRADALSGGERQRVAIARTLMTQPRLLLLDEPLAALDVGRKGEILPYLEALPARFGIPAIYVSHSIDEIAKLADRVLVLEQGQVKALGGAADVLNQLDMQSPSSRFDVITILETRLLDHLPDLELTRLDHRGQTIVVPKIAQHEKGDNVRLHIRAGDVALATKKPEGISFRNVLSGTLSQVDADRSGAFATISVDIDGAILRAHLTRQAVEDLGLVPGTRVFALLKTASFDRPG